MGKLFGTDGIRGIVGRQLTAELAFRVGQAVVTALQKDSTKKSKFIIGRDTRISSEMIESSICAGIASVGGDIVSIGVTPTPAVAFLTDRTGADAGIMVSASHNPYEHNGIKVFNSKGHKLPDSLEEEIESLILGSGVFKAAELDKVGRISADLGLIGDYLDYIKSTVNCDLKGMRIAVDCANGSASATASKLFSAFDAQIDVYNNTPDGININDNCGSTHLSKLGDLVRYKGYDLGIAFDGDADRCLIVDEKGREVDGDRIMAVCGAFMRERGELPDDTIVATVMSNLGFHVYNRNHGVKVITAQVGDRYVLEEMQKGGFMLGGEQSGHLIFLKYMPTGDGQLTALQFLNVLASSGATVSGLVSDIPQFPQILLNVQVLPEAKAGLSEHPDVLKAIESAKASLGEGRILVRPSGTEPLVRVMVEGMEESAVKQAAESIVDVIKIVAT